MTDYIELVLEGQEEREGTLDSSETEEPVERGQWAAAWVMPPYRGRDAEGQAGGWMGRFATKADGEVLLPGGGPLRERGVGDGRPHPLALPAEREPGRWTAARVVPPYRGRDAEGQGDGLPRRFALGTDEGAEDGEIFSPGFAEGLPGKRAGTEALYRRLRQSEAAAGYRGVTIGTGISTGVTGRENSLSEMDAVFRRDARRYDGGFELY